MSIGAALLAERSISSAVSAGRSRSANSLLNAASFCEEGNSPSSSSSAVSS
jgi:hypothetical protein